MVNTGKPSRGCAICKTRKIKCDLANPACLQCVRSGWTCPGVQSELDSRFRDQTDVMAKSMRRKNIAKDLTRNPYSGSSNLDGGRIRSLSPSLLDRATAFFIHQYVFQVDESNSAPARGNHEYLPALISQEDVNGPLRTIIAAAGLAALSNAGNSSAWAVEAYQWRSKAIRQLQFALNDPVRNKSDHTLATIMFMGTFETIASGDADSMESFSHHTIAAAHCIQLRGPTQFRSEAAVKLFLQMRRILVMTCHQLQEPIPYALEKWSRWAECMQCHDESPANRFSEINEHLATVRAEIKHEGISSPPIIAARLLSVDEELVKWERNLPESWAYKSYRSTNFPNSLSGRWTSQYDVYPDLWVASMWNNYRSVRLLIHEAIIKAAMKYGSAEEKQETQSSVRVLVDMTNDVCRSVAYHLGYFRNISQETNSNKTIGTELLPTPGGYLLMWPLFLSGMLRSTPKDQRHWIASTLSRIGTGMGLRLALSMATILEETEKSFSDSEVWFIGEFYP